MGVFLQPAQGWTSSYYLGIGPLVLALVAIWKARRPMVWLCGLVFGISIILALGDAGHLFSWLRTGIPQIGVMRYPVKFVVLAAAVVPLLAAFAIAHWQRSKERRLLEPATIVTAATCLALMGVIVFFSLRFPGHGEQPQRTLINGLSRGGALILVLAFLYALRSPATSRRTALLQLGFVGAVWLDLISHAPRQNPSVDAQAYQLALPMFAEMQPRPKSGQSRALLSWQAIDNFHSVSVSNAFQAVLGVRMGLFDNCNLLEDIPKIDGFYSLYIPEEEDVRLRMFPSTNAVRSGLADFLGVSQTSSDAKFLDWDARPTWMPTITTGQRPEFATLAQSLEGMLHADFDPRKTVYLPLEAKEKIEIKEMAALSNTAPAHILSQTFSPHRIVVEAEASDLALLVVAQTFYHNWKARVDGHSTTLWRANHGFQAVQLPKGHHRVELVYEDRALRCGAMISVATLLGCTGLFLRLKRKQRSP